MSSGFEISVIELAAEVVARIPDGRRYVLGIAGPPAAGKSTLAQNLAAAVWSEHAVPAEIAPMDGFHKTSAELEAVGARHRKGEPDTFDVAGFVERLKLLREAPLGQRVMWPIYDRGLHDPVPDAITFAAQRLAVVEGNYLLLDQPGWSEVRAHLDEVWYLDAKDDVIERRLTDRHLLGGKTIEQAKVKIADSDMPNARLIAGTRDHASSVLRENGGRYIVIRAGR
ncbi:nucleoside/nucleotide kinase family protein [Nocardia sp. BMG111209]|uniref:nucleoside/nucleotide kinase family protein n=1 Tax=Nocardia sp. BMG111209 TaxID=1160137 RepID=UPI00039E6063|nr:nucleoside/nucleotide kinase family protein [Nocardia sp. BMG111209]